jgi:PhnB protein
VSEEFDPLRALLPDRVMSDEPVDPTVFAREKERLMATIGENEPAVMRQMPDLYPRLAYEDERAALEYLTRVFLLEEIREARAEPDGDSGSQLAWLRVGTGVVMIGHANAEVHMIHSPKTIGNTTVELRAYVPNVDALYAHAVDAGAEITTELHDAFYGERCFEATDLEGHRWQFTERFDDIKARGGSVDAG